MLLPFIVNQALQVEDRLQKWTVACDPRCLAWWWQPHVVVIPERAVVERQPGWPARLAQAIAESTELDAARAIMRFMYSPRHWCTLVPAPAAVLPTTVGNLACPGWLGC